MKLVTLLMCSLLLAGCATIEHNTETPTKAHHFIV